ncbi:S8 family peptidase [Pseudalkalibacillus caeni]|uniref:Peptidase S8 n=1 Tax=Exobacillus caeni TaxID=2574798 RepID=A0A5R9F200_9BACL|nr:S8 family peptidase [Pseudalkalibacillus caeni]TLS36426.1 peptidase S8 [Pseudalkalibacillus caeni]
MRMKFLAGIFLVALIGLVTLLRPTDDSPKNQMNTSLPEVSSPEVNRKQMTAKIMRVDSVRTNNHIVQKLNSSPNILNIDHNGKEKSHYIKDQVTVKFNQLPEKAELDRLLKAVNGRLLKKSDNNLYVFKSDSMISDELVSFFEKQKNVNYAEPNFILLQNQPNDVFYQKYQYNLPMIQTEKGWDISRGVEDVTIAVIDTGVDLDHPDLQGRLSKGYNVLEGNSKPEDDNGHGTHVAGIIASKINNNEGVAGITWYNKIMPIKAMSGEGHGTSYDIAQGIIWATDHGADVINMSLGNYQPSSVMKEAIRYAYNKDVVLIAASGNDSSNQPSYPASFKEVLSVAAVDANKNRAAFSNFGSTVDIAAPGVNIASTFVDHQYAALSGTSMASPHVAALAGLIRSYNPDLSNREVMDLIKQTSDDLGDKGKDIYYGHGLIDVVQALESSYKQKYPMGKFSEWLERLMLIFN